MPFTPVHPAAVLPFLRSPLVPAALVAGAVAPDLPYYVSLQWIGGDYNLTRTHAWTSLFWLDPLIGLVLLAVFQMLLRRPLTALLPEPAAARVPLSRPPLNVGAVVVSLVVGAATHLAWDSLGDVFGPRWSTGLNLVSDALGTVVLVVWMRRHWQTTTPHPVPPGVLLPRGARSVVLAVLVSVTVAWGTFRAHHLIPLVSHDLRSQGLYNRPEVVDDAVREFAIQAGAALAAAVLLYAVAWYLTARLRAGQPVSSR